MEIVLNRKSGVPLYLQVKKQIMDLIRMGKIKVGSKMPTERELSKELKVSRNTISTAYKELEQAGVLKSYQGKGTFVIEEVISWQDKDKKDKILKFLDLALEQAFESGMDIEGFLQLVNDRVREKKELMKKMVSVYVECNIEQAKMFSKQLSKRTNMNVIPLTVADLRAMDVDTVGKLNKAQVIISTFNHVNEVYELTKDLKKEVFGVAISPDLETIVKIARYPVTSKLGFVCISEEFMFKVRGALEKAGLGEINIQFTNTFDEEKLKLFISSHDVIVVSPGRYKDVSKLNTFNREIIEFKYGLDDGSVKALKSKIVEIGYDK
ncbi:HTH-type transcriptional repressor YtrA [Clostridium tepidiprofundi DSM 19306]|uniref:HTH-type transcriptional repressor YtrA n=1 Tax=Clostridium tepidiprofundi DSM 19306 TaxID=1121338 RepID=A0A151B5Q6_9CLOT|nr:winged helix-turn-helix domain-containing protein [Clostridium tepidiprofundi]KYH35216.1 HTH-type transcriptional repressor YtrA [Clostridium tepidiprofundi DSM 19306]